ncbi:superoxide dismutase, partial [Guyparkeria sp. LHSS19-1]
MAFQLPDLPYGYGDLEKSIDAQTMELHHTKHHNTYVTKLNDAIKDSEWDEKPIDEIMANISKLPTAVRNNGGGHYNHDLFWKLMSPNGGGKPSGALADDIASTFG